MDRRTFLAGTGAVLLAVPLAAEGQQAAKVARIGFLSPGGLEQDRSLAGALREQLRERGWIEGQNLVVEWRHAEGNYDRLFDLAIELLRSNPDLVVARGGPAATAAKRATPTIPIVMWNATDPVGIGLIASRARPGGNVTGLSDDQGAEIVGKRLQLLKEVVPSASKLALLDRVAPSAAVPRMTAYYNAYEASAKALGLQFRIWHLAGPDDIEKAFTAIVREGFGVLDVPYAVVTWTHRRQIMNLAARHRLPAIYWHRTYALDGGLMAYGEDEREVPRRLATYVDKVLRGAKPADLPVEGPGKFELVINLKTAKALGLTIPPSLLGRADEVIQ
jgi:putative ABC transport system substrate-binding protein